MKDRRDEKIKQLERRILKASRVSRQELREIVDAPQLLDKINARIKVSRAAAEKPARRRFPFQNFPKIGLAFGAAAAFLLFASGFIFLPQAEFSVARLAEKVAAPETDAQPEFTGRPDIEEKNEIAAFENHAAANKPALKNAARKSERRVPGVNKSRRTRPADAEPEEAFYPLAFAENIEEAREAGQVIRVELSRSSLLALGVNPPNDDENLKVKTDLLIGADGVARGIRFVK